MNIVGNNVYIARMPRAKMLSISTSILIFFSLTLLQPVQAAPATPKPGATCSKVGLTSIAGNQKFICVKSGKKMVWSKSVKVTSSPTPSAAIVPVFTGPVTATNIPALITPAVLPIPVPAVNSNYVFLKTDPNGKGARRDTCKKDITWTIFSGAPDRMYALAVKNFQTTANATGFSFRYVDPGAVGLPATFKLAQKAAVADIQFYFAPRANFAPDTVITSGASNGVDVNPGATWNGKFSEIERSTVGQVSDFAYPAQDFGQVPEGNRYRGALGQVMLHEIGHAMGLGHPLGQGDVMSRAYPQPSNGDYGPGDKYGLYQLSAANPCGS
jgi:hypothetical protein